MHTRDPHSDFQFPAPLLAATRLLSRLIPSALRNPVTRLEHALSIVGVVCLVGGPMALAGGFSSAGGTADPLVPADGTQNITGGLTVSGGITQSTGNMILSSQASQFGWTGSVQPSIAGNGGTGKGILLTSSQVDNASAQSFTLTSDTTLSNAAAKLLSVQNNSTEKVYAMQDGALGSKSTMTSGSITLSTGTGTATVLSGAKCVCSEATDATKTVKCAVATTTLTATGTGSDVINYVCIGQ